MINVIIYSILYSKHRVKNLQCSKKILKNIFTALGLLKLQIVDIKNCRRDFSLRLNKTHTQVNKILIKLMKLSSRTNYR